MTDERMTDEHLAVAYRDLATEKTPEHLDDAVLRMAASKAEHPRYSRSIMWTRPLAWAATIALCLAITLEVTRAPVPDANVTSPGLEPKSLPAPPARQKLEKTNEPQVAPEQDQAETEAATQGYLLNKQLADEPTEEARANFNDAQLPRADAERVPASASMAFEVKDADMLRRAENQARLQSGNNKDDAVEEVTALAASIDSAATPEECSAEARAAPDSWLACIEALEAADDTEAALRQRDRLVEVFPDFKLP